MADQFAGMPEMPAVPIGWFAEVGMIAAQVAQLAQNEASHAGGGTYQFSPDELRSVINQWNDLGQSVTRALSTMDFGKPTSSGQIAPGNEVASDVVASAANTSNWAYQSYLQSMNTYISAYVNKLNGALQNYLTTEQGNASIANGQL
jgi:hypothetical protein